MKGVGNVFIFLLVCFICLLIMANSINHKTEEFRYQKGLLYKKYDSLKLITDSLELILDSLPLGSPLDTIIISDNFGIRKDPILKIWRQHPGIDLKGTYTDTIYATGSGRIIKANRYGGYGRCVEIEHVGGYKSLYGHMNKIFVKTGNKIKNGHAIGTVGSTGFSTGPHLHYEIIRFGKRTDPKYFLIS